MILESENGWLQILAFGSACPRRVLSSGWTSRLKLFGGAASNVHQCQISFHLDLIYRQCVHTCDRQTSTNRLFTHSLKVGRLILHNLLLRVWLCQGTHCLIMVCSGEVFTLQAPTQMNGSRAAVQSAFHVHALDRKALVWGAEGGAQMHTRSTRPPQDWGRDISLGPPLKALRKS